MKPLPRLCLKTFLGMCLVAASGGLTPLLGQVQVNSATPPAAAQGTINLNVVIGGSGFKKGATAQWFVTGTTNPGGVIVNSTAFNSQTQLTANITIADNADISNYDVVVYSSGRTGKGTGLFSVTQKGTPTGCTTLGTPSGFSLVTTLNPLNSSGTSTYPGAFGGEIRVRPVTVSNGTSSRTVLVAAVSTNAAGNMEFFFLDPAGGLVLDGQSLLAGSPPQPHVTVIYNTSGIGERTFTAGDVNSDGIPDFAGGSRTSNIAFVFVGSMDANGILSYQSFQLNPPSGSPGSYGSGVALGNFDGIPGDEVAVSAVGGGSGSSTQAGEVFIYSYTGSGFNLIDTLKDPLPNTKKDDAFGVSLAVGEVTNPLAPNLIVGAGNATVNGNTSAGRIFIFPAPISSPTTYYTLTSGIQNDNLGGRVGAGNVNGSVDVFGTSAAGVEIFSGPITTNLTVSSLTFAPDPRLTTTGWATNIDFGDLLGTGQSEIFVGVPDANNSNSCNVNVGAAELYFPSRSNLPQPTFTFQTPILNSSSGLYGWGVGLVPGSAGNPAFLMVGEVGIGQVYIYKKN